MLLHRYYLQLLFYFFVLLLFVLENGLTNGFTATNSDDGKFIAINLLTFIFTYGILF